MNARETFIQKLAEYSAQELLKRHAQYAARLGHNPADEAAHDMRELVEGELLRRLG